MGGGKWLEVILTFYKTVDDTMTLSSEVKSALWSQANYLAALIK